METVDDLIFLEATDTSLVIGFVNEAGNFNGIKVHGYDIVYAYDTSDHGLPVTGTIVTIEPFGVDMALCPSLTNLPSISFMGMLDPNWMMPSRLWDLHHTFPNAVAISDDEADALRGSKRDDVVGTGGGDDHFNARDGNDFFSGGGGHDVFLAGKGNDEGYGGDGDDWLMGESGIDCLDGGKGEDLIIGGDGADELYGGGHDDTIFGDDGDYAYGYDDFLCGMDGNDQLMGGGGDDILRGGKGDDLLDGGLGDDIMRGGRGDDTMMAYDGSDFMRGGQGADIFCFYDLGPRYTAQGQIAEEKALVKDFTPGEDKIWLGQNDDKTGEENYQDFIDNAVQKNNSVHWVSDHGHHKVVFAKTTLDDFSPSDFLDTVSID